MILLRSPRVIAPQLTQPHSLSDTDPGERVEYSKDVAEPPQNANHNDSIQDRLDGICHWDELIDQPEDNPDDNQREQYLS